MAVAANKSLRPWRSDGRELSPERNPVWTEPRADKTGGKAKAVPVVYYLSRNGQLEHPHFMEVTLASPEGLYLRDVIHRLNLLRGKGMASLYAWSSKRSYKNGFVWHDLTEDDFIHPAHGNEYVLKGSELLLQIDPLASSSSAGAAVTSSPGMSASVSLSSGSTSSSSSSVSSDKDAVAAAPSKLRKKPPHRWGSLDLGEYKVVYKSTATNGTDAGECGSKHAAAAAAAADAATQTDDQQQRLRQWRRRDRARSEIPDLEVQHEDGTGIKSRIAVATASTTTELEREEISPPPASSSPETLETLIKADVGRARASAAAASDHHQRDLGLYPTGRARASAVLINLISCGAISVKDHHATAVTPQYSRHHHPQQNQNQNRMPPRGGEMTDPRAYATFSGAVSKKEFATECRGFPTVQLEDKEYFSGSLIETKKKGAADGAGEFAALKRSNSYNADRSSKMVMEMTEREREMEMDAVRSKCIPRRPKAAAGSGNGVNCRKDAGGAAVARSSAHGSKRISNAGDETSM